MPIEDRVCTKCGAAMKPGYPLESFGKAGGFKTLTTWVDGVPKIEQGWLGEYLDARQDQRRYLLGFCCETCGIVELYAVSEADARFLATQHRESKSKGE